MVLHNKIANQVHSLGEPSLEKQLDHFSNEQYSALKDVLKTYGIYLEALHFDHPDSLLRSHFLIEVSDPDQIELIIDKISECEGVEAVYTKGPSDFPF